MAPPSRLDRRLGLVDAVAVGLGAMLGAGLFVVYAPAAARAGSWLLAALLLAAAVAWCNATSTAQLAACHPEAGGAYAYGRHRLSPAAGALAGYAFVVGKAASAAAAALTVGAYALPDSADGARALAVAVVVALGALNILGVRRTARATEAMLAVLLLALGAVVTGLFLGDPSATAAQPGPDPGVGGVLGAAGLLFFAFAGYARIATLGEEVRDPARTIPRAVPLALGAALAVYLLIGVALLRVLGPAGLAVSPTPVADAVAVAAPALEPVARAAAALAALGVALSLLAGLSRTVFAMAAGGDLPAALAAVSQRRTPAVAEAGVGLVVVAAVAVGGLTAAVAWSAAAVLVYYAVANAAALRLAPAERRWPRVYARFGLVACLVLAASLPPGAVLGTVGLLAGLLLVRLVRRRRSRSGSGDRSAVQGSGRSP